MSRRGIPSAPKPLAPAKGTSIISALGPQGGTAGAKARAKAAKAAAVTPSSPPTPKTPAAAAAGVGFRQPKFYGAKASTRVPAKTKTKAAAPQATHTNAGVERLLLSPGQQRRP